LTGDKFETGRDKKRVERVEESRGARRRGR
jgi:hypothetical protein